MASPYSNDLRRKLLEAHERGEGSLSQLAKRFAVSLGWAKKVSAALAATGAMERPAGGKRGPVSKVTPTVEASVRSWISEQPDLTLAELQERLWAQRKLKISIGRLWTVLREMGLRLKKSRSTPPSRTPRKSASGGASGERKLVRSMRRG
jgi:transposase